MERFKGWQGKAALWIIAVFGFALLSYLFDGDHASYALALKDEFSSEASGAAIGIAVSIALAFVAYFMFETSMMVNAIVIAACGAWLISLYFWG